MNYDHYTDCHLAASLRQSLSLSLSDLLYSRGSGQRMPLYGRTLRCADTLNIFDKFLNKFAFFSDDDFREFACESPHKGGRF